MSKSAHNAHESKSSNKIESNLLTFSISLLLRLPFALTCSTYSGTTLRRSIICIGLLTLGLLSFQTGWETTKIVNHKKDIPFMVSGQTVADFLPIDSGIWFDALVQVLFSTNIGIGLLPVVTGKFIYKGDAVRYVNSIFVAHCSTCTRYSLSTHGNHVLIACHRFSRFFLCAELLWFTSVSTCWYCCCRQVFS